MDEKALVLLSGGLDSTTCLYWAKKNYKQVEAICFHYGQRHGFKEAESAYIIAKNADIILHTYSVGPSYSGTMDSALFEASSISIGSPHRGNKDLPSSFVPGRNIILLSHASAYAYSKEIFELVIGVNVVDWSGYPDCRQETICALEYVFRKGIDDRFRIRTPLIYMKKSEIVKLASCLECYLELAYTHTCYLGKNPPCGECSACKIRAKGFEEAGLLDPLIVNIQGRRN